MTARTLFERLYLVPGLGKFGPWVNCPCVPHPHYSLNLTTISWFPRSFSPQIALQFFYQHDSPSNLAESRYPQRTVSRDTNCVLRFCRQRSLRQQKQLVMIISLYEYGVATISRLLEIIGLFCKRALWKRWYSPNDTYDFSLLIEATPYCICPCNRHFCVCVAPPLSRLQGHPHISRVWPLKSQNHTKHIPIIRDWVWVGFCHNDNVVTIQGGEDA